MIDEEKQLLLKDLCGRLLYNVKVYLVYNAFKSETKEMGLSTLHDIMFDNAKGKPYLRPMSSMTEEEVIELSYSILGQPDLSMVRNWDFIILDSETLPRVFDWLNAHHFDYRGLIPMGLALEAPADMYEIK